MNSFKLTHWLMVLVILSTIVLYGCNQSKEYKFKLTKHAANKGQALGPVRVKSYSAGYNPKAYGNIIITMDDGSEYTVAGLEPANMSILLQLLSLKNLQIDSANNELSVKGVRYE